MCRRNVWKWGEEVVPTAWQGHGVWCGDTIQKPLKLVLYVRGEPTLITSFGHGSEPACMHSPLKTNSPLGTPLRAAESAAFREAITRYEGSDFLILSGLRTSPVAEAIKHRLTSFYKSVLDYSCSHSNAIKTNHGNERQFCMTSVIYPSP